MNAANVLKITAPTLFAAALDHRVQRAFGLRDYDIHVDIGTDPQSIFVLLELIDPVAALKNCPAALPLLAALVKAICDSTSTSTLPVEFCASLVSLADLPPPTKHHPAQPDLRRVTGIKFLQSVVAYAVSCSSTEAHWGMPEAPTFPHRRGVIL